MAMRASCHCRQWRRVFLQLQFQSGFGPAVEIGRLFHIATGHATLLKDLIGDRVKKRCDDRIQPPQRGPDGLRTSQTGIGTDAIPRGLVGADDLLK